MEPNTVGSNHSEDDEEYVLLDLDGVSEHVQIPADTPYTLSGFDTLNPVLAIGNQLKLIGEYDETFGTGLIFSEHDGEKGPSEENQFGSKCLVDDNPTAAKQLKPIARLYKILKFRSFVKDDDPHESAKPREGDDPQPVNSNSS